MCPQQSSVAILLATYNGGEFLIPQLNSFCSQSYPSWKLYVSDDGSTDNTLSILESFSSHDSGINVYAGPKKGFAQNFISLIKRQDIEASYYAFSDQDDIWCKDKLARAVGFLKDIHPDIPALYCSRTKLIDSSGNEIGYSTFYKKPPGFGHSLIQNIASGNTMVFNHSAKKMLECAYGKPIVAHDWTLYQIVSACGGVVFYDEKPTLLYRQHGGNLIGSGLNPLQRMNNFFAALNGRTAKWNDINLSILQCGELKLSADASKKIQCIKEMRNSNLLRRVKIYHSSGLYHQNLIGTLTNYCYAVLNKF
ncbi:glycosyltransferase family 2 protein [Pantoea allii]|uniref:glycosyltransferase family 2 protein n=1 Tax=Pantoea allii TaxID=574096 RepID=UPI00397754E4